ncbi:Forkhead box protein J2 [Linnemannia gamsii]|uniref:Forkhead box protein J2 n=1 Tax=Linnemannia gamsii TaxID=64522 RepID=A0ABQ7K2F2_9FUNG|nr:Forkhead box protein J2 [Linnemannia gamsii]
MPVLVDVNEPSQLPRQPHPQQQQQHEQQQRVHCSSSNSRRQPLVDIENTETLTEKEKEDHTSPSNDSHPDSKENCPPPPKAACKRSRSTVLVKGIESMPVQTFSIVLPSRSGGGDTSAKCGAASVVKVETEVEGKSNKALKARVTKGERRDVSKEISRVNLESTRSRGGRAGVNVAVVASTDSASQSGEPVTTMIMTTTSADMYRKPDISYSHLILHAISQSPNERLTLREIYAWIETRHPFYRDSPTGWQNSIRHNLSSSKAFVKLERVKNDSGKGCFWSLHEDANEILAVSSSKKGRKSLADHADNRPATSPTSPTSSAPTSTSTTTVVRARGTSSLPKINCKQDGSPRSDLPSPAASEPYDDPKSPRPVRSKAKEVYAPSTPPSSPDYEADLEDKDGALGNRSTTASTTDKASSVANPLEFPKTPMSPSSESVPATTRRVRRPPQNLSEFVSSEDFKASFGKETLSAIPSTPLSPKPVERKRSKTLPAVATTPSRRERSSSSERVLSKVTSPYAPSTTDEPSPTTPTEELAALALAPSLSQELPEEVPLHRLVSVPLSSLSHMTHLKRSRDDVLSGTTTKIRRREEQRQDHRSRGRGRSNSLQETAYERRCREGKREIVVASEDDWSSDSDDDLHYDSDLDGCYGDGVQLKRSSSSFNKADLLLDSSAISYGFEMTDSEYILDFNQGPLFNSVVWPEYSNLQGLEDPTAND